MFQPEHWLRFRLYVYWLVFTGGLSLLTDGLAFDTYASLGKCHDECLSNYAFAIVQGSTCWCSNYAPADTVPVTECNEACPGWPYEFCGSPNSGLYGYLALSDSPSGTVGAPSTTSAAVSYANCSLRLSLLLPPLDITVIAFLHARLVLPKTI